MKSGKREIVYQRRGIRWWTGQLVVGGQKSVVNVHPAGEDDSSHRFLLLSSCSKADSIAERTVPSCSFAMTLLR